MAEHGRKKIFPYLPPCTRLNPKWIKTLNIIYNMNLADKKVGKCLELIVTRKDFVNMALLLQALISEFNKWDFMKIRSFCMGNNTNVLKK